MGDSAAMITSNLNGQFVRYTDFARYKHSGVIVGQSEDRKWYLVKSDNPNVPVAEWHFRIRVSAIERYLRHDA